MSAVVTDILGPASLGLVEGFLCFFLILFRASLFILCYLCFWCIFSCLFWVVSTSASDCLERHASNV